MKKIKEIIEVIKIILLITISPILAEYLGNLVTIQFIISLVAVLTIIAGIVLVKIEIYETKIKKAEKRKVTKRRKQIQIFDF